MLDVRDIPGLRFQAVKTSTTSSSAWRLAVQAEIVGEIVQYKSGCRLCCLRVPKGLHPRARRGRRLIAHCAARRRRHRLRSTGEYIP
jgi:hypothetical protein